MSDPLILAPGRSSSYALCANNRADSRLRFEGWRGSKLRRAASFITLLVLMAHAWPVTGSVRPQDEKNTGASQSNRQGSIATDDLEPGKPIEKELSGGQSHSYRLQLAKGQYVHVVVDQRGIDVVVALYGPEGKKLTEVDSPNGTQGPEPVSWIVETTGTYRLEVRSLEKDAKPGKYEAKIERLREADPQDVYRLRAQQFLAEAEQLKSQGTTESIRKSMKNLAEAVGRCGLQVSRARRQLS